MTLLDRWMEEAAKHLRVPLRDGHICDCEHDGGIHDDLPRALAILRAAAALAEGVRILVPIGRITMEGVNERGETVVIREFLKDDAKRVVEALAAFDEAVKETA